MLRSLVGSTSGGSELASDLEAQGRTQEEQLRLGHLLKVMSHLRPGLVQC